MVPAAHLAQDPLSAPAENLPLSQSTQEEVATVENLPAKQISHEDCSVVAAILPAAHSSHSLRP